MEDLISRQAAIELIERMKPYHQDADDIAEMIANMPSAQHEIVHCKECEYGVQDDNGNWYCHGLGCTIGSEDGSGFCADAERRKDGSD